MKNKNHMQEQYQNYRQRISFQQNLKILNGIHLGTKTLEGSDLYIGLEKLLKLLETHIQIIGPTGCGKSKLMEHIFRQLVDKLKQASFVVIDPKGDLYRALLRFCLAHNFADRLVIFDPGESNQIIGYNPMNATRQSTINQTLTVVEAIRACWGQETWDQTPQLARWLTNGIYTLISSQASFIEAPDVFNFQDSWKRNLFIKKLGLTEEIERVIKEEWDNFTRLSLPRRKDDINSSYARIRSFCMHPAIINIMSQQKRAMDLHRIIQEGKILLVNLERYKPLRPDLVYLLGTILINDLIGVAFSREEEERNPCYLFIDEFHHFATRDLIPILEEGRAFKLHLILAHQSLNQLNRKDPDIYDAVMTNARTKIVFGGLTNPNLEILSPELFTQEIDPYKEKDVIKSPVFEPAEEVRYVPTFSASKTKGHNVQAGLSLGIGKGFNESETISETESIAQSKARMKGTTSTTGGSEGEGHGDTSVFSSSEGISYPMGGLGFFDGTSMSSSSHSMGSSSIKSKSSLWADSMTEAESEGELKGLAKSKAKTSGSNLNYNMGLNVSRGTNRSTTKGLSVTRQPFHAYKKYEIVSQRKFQEVEEQFFEKLQILKGLKKRQFVIKLPEKEPIQLTTPWVEATKEERALTQPQIRELKEKIFLETGFYSTPLEIKEERQRQLEAWQKEHQGIIDLEKESLPKEPTTFRYKRKPRQT